MRRVQLPEPYKGHWIDFDPDVPWQLYEQAAGGDEAARREFSWRVIGAWDLGPLPESPADLPWDLEVLIPRLFSEAHALSGAEEGDILQRVWTGQSAVAIPELDRFRLCERLGVGLAPDFQSLKAGETLRLVRALSCWDEIAEQKSDEKG